MNEKSHTNRLILSELVSFAVGGLAILYYWFHASYETIGIVLTLEYLTSISNVLLWFNRTKAKQ